MLPILLFAATAPAAVAVPAQAALTEQVARADEELFDLFFVRPCDEPRMRALLAPDLEFYHDKAGVTARSADEFVAGYLKNCLGRADPKAWRSRRELVRASLRVDPVPGYGAMEIGEHHFYERHGVEGAEKLAGTARFAMVWALGSDGRWRVSRVLSYAHEAAK